MSENSKRAEFELAFLYDPESAKRAAADVEALKKAMDELGRKNAKAASSANATGARGGAQRVKTAEQELAIQAKAQKRDQKRRDDYVNSLEKEFKARDREGEKRVREVNKLREAEEKIAERQSKETEREAKAVEQRAKRTQKEIEAIEKRATKEQERADKARHREELQATKRVTAEQLRENRRIDQERRASERRALAHERQIARIKERTEKAEWRHNLRMQAKRDGMVREGISRAGSGIRTGLMRAGAGTLAAGALGVQAHLEMSKSTAEIQTLKPGFTEEESKKMIKDGMATYGGDTGTTGKAIYDIVSAGYGNSLQQTQDVFDAASALAVGGVTDVSTAADGLTSALNAWKDKGYSATDVTDQFFQAVKLGKTTVSELSGAIGTFAPMAQSAGVDLSESMAVIVEVTKQGVKSASAASGLRQMIKSITSPTKQAEDAAKSMGIKVGASAIRDAGGLDSWLSAMMNSKKFSEDKMSDIFSDVDGRVIVDALRSLGKGGFATAVANQRGAGGATKAAVDTMMNSDYMRAQKIMGEVKVALVEFGEALMPLVRDVMPGVTKGIQDFRSWLESPENREFLASAAKITVMLGGLAAIGGPLASLIQVLNLLSAGGLASGATRLASGVAGAAGALGPFGLALVALMGTVAMVSSRMDELAQIEEDELERRKEIANAGTLDERDGLLNDGGLEDEREIAFQNLEAEHARYVEFRDKQSLIDKGLDVAAGWLGEETQDEKYLKTRNAANEKLRRIDILRERMASDIAPYESEMDPAMSQNDKAKLAYRRRFEDAVNAGEAPPELPYYFSKKDRDWVNDVWSGGQSVYPGEAPNSSQPYQKTRKLTRAERRDAQKELRRIDKIEKLERQSLPRSPEFPRPSSIPYVTHEPNASMPQETTVTISVNEKELNKVIDVRVEKKQREQTRRIMSSPGNIQP
jgi:TP901 family phage tail tape measure protein